MPEQFILLLIIGISAGILSGLFGIGGGVIIVPALVTLVGFGLREACGISLAALLLPVGLFAVIIFRRAKSIDLRASLFIAIGLLTGVFGGAKLALYFDAGFMKILYGIFLFFIGLRFINPIERIRKLFGKEVKSVIEQQTKQIKWNEALLLGIFAGILSGLFGIGGGVIIVPVLVSMMKYDQKVAAGTSLGALLLPVGLPGVMVYLKAGTLSILSAAPVAFGLLLGAYLGAHIAVRVPSKLLKSAYGIFLLFIAIRFVL